LFSKDRREVKGSVGVTVDGTDQESWSDEKTWRSIRVVVERSEIFERGAVTECILILDTQTNSYA